MPRILLVSLLSLAPVLLVAGCASNKAAVNDAEIPTLPKLDAVMEVQSQTIDPQFKKIGQPAYTDEDFAGFTLAANRLKLTSARVKGFSKGPEFDALADQVATHADELIAAAGSHDVAKASAALAATKSTCKACHSKFR